MLITRPVKRGSVLAISSVLFSAENDENRNPTTTSSANATGNERVDEKPIRASPSAIARPTWTVAGRGTRDSDATTTAGSAPAEGAPRSGGEVMPRPGQGSSAVPMTLAKRADAGNLHVRGFKGRGPRDHFQHLYLLGDVLRAWVVPRWKQSDRVVYTLAGEQL